MKSIQHFTYFFVIFLSNSYGQGPFMEFDSAINQYDSLGRKTGAWTEYDSAYALVISKQDHFSYHALTDTGCINGYMPITPPKIDTVDHYYVKISPRYGLFLEGKKHGPWIGFYGSGSIIYMLTYDHGVPVGTAYNYSSDGTITQTILFDKKKSNISTVMRMNDEGEMMSVELPADVVLDAFFF